MCFFSWSASCSKGSASDNIVAQRKHSKTAARNSVEQVVGRESGSPEAAGIPTTSGAKTGRASAGRFGSVAELAWQQRPQRGHTCRAQRSETAALLLSKRKKKKKQGDAEEEHHSSRISSNLWQGEEFGAVVGGVDSCAADAAGCPSL